MSRPEPPRCEHAGFHYEPVVDHTWVTPAVGAGRCRWMQGRVCCGRAPVATLMRSARPRARPHDYCERHLYGRWIEGGKVMGWRLVRDDALREARA